MGSSRERGSECIDTAARLTYVITHGSSSSALDLTGMAGLAAVRHLASFHRGGVATPQLSSGGSDDGGSPPSPGTTTTTPPPSPSPGGVGGKGRSSPLLETPTRKNKRKLSEPRKRGGGGGGGTDFSIKRLCTDSPGGSAMSESGCSDDGGEADSHRGRRVRRRLSHDDSASSRGLSEREDTPVPGGSGGGGGGGGGGLTLGAGGQAPHHPFFPSGLPPTTCFMPGFYLHAADGRAGGFPPPPFPGLPLALPHPGLQAVAAAAAAADHQRGDGGLGDLSSGRSSGLGHHHGHHHHHHHPGLHAQDLSRDDSPDNLSGDDSTNGGGSGGGGRKPRKNYKNMTRERRVEANARERTRVHTISAAFDALRRAVPSYSYNQKLSKLAILRIACTYIMALARLADVDCSSEPSVPVTFADCVDLCTRTIQTEGRARRRH